MGQKVKPDIQSSYIPLDMAASVNEWDEGVQGGVFCRIDALKETFAWMRGFVNGWYGWSNDGKGTFLDYLMVIMAKYEGWKFCVYKPEDMDSIKNAAGKSIIQANRIYKNLAWTLTGKTWSKNFAEKHFVKRMTLQEEMEALDFITKHFFVIHPRDRKYKNLLDDFRFMHDKYVIDSFLIDPWNAVILPPAERGDERLINAFIDVKEFTLETNSIFNIVNHPKSMMDVRQGKDKDSPFKIVNQFMQLGGSAWDIKMDGQYSIYRPERHLKSSDPKVELHNLKQRQAEIVGVTRGECKGIEFSFTKKQYYFNGVNPMDGSTKEDKHKPTNGIFDYSYPKVDDEPFKTDSDPDKVPF